MKTNLIFILIFILSCNQPDNNLKSDNATNNCIDSGQDKPQNSVWKGKNSEICITFEKDKLFLWFSYLGQCVYEFPMNKGNNKFEVFWKINEDCVFESGLKKTYGLNKYPKDNEIFMVLELIDVTTINVSYNYPEWIEKFN